MQVGCRQHHCHVHPFDRSDAPAQTANPQGVIPVMAAPGPVKVFTGLVPHSVEDGFPGFLDLRRTVIGWLYHFFSKSIDSHGMGKKTLNDRDHTTFSARVAIGNFTPFKPANTVSKM